MSESESGSFGESSRSLCPTTSNLASTIFFFLNSISQRHLIMFLVIVVILNEVLRDDVARSRDSSVAPERPSRSHSPVIPMTTFALSLDRKTIRNQQNCTYRRYRTTICNSSSRSTLAQPAPSNQPTSLQVQLGISLPLSVLFQSRRRKPTFSINIPTHASRDNVLDITSPAKRVHPRRRLSVPPSLDSSRRIPVFAPFTNRPVAKKTPRLFLHRRIFTP